MNLDPNLQKDLKAEGLRYCPDSVAGFFRQKNGRDFNYYDLEGQKITNQRALNRINSLAIPPAWKNVWVCPQENGHLQATGIDEKGRKQYLYHPDWIKISQENKFSKLVDFGSSLPIIRSKINYYLMLKEAEKRKILATVIWLLEHTFIRVGNDEYAQDNNSYGLTTLRSKHTDVRGSQVTFSFIGKSGVNHLVKINNPTIAKTIKDCMDLPGYELFQFIDEDGDRHTIDSADVNQFLQDLTENDFSAKDFRTWGGTVLAATNLNKSGPAPDPKTLKNNLNLTVKQVAEHLRNTPAVCRQYYIHPQIFETYSNNILIPHFQSKSSKKLKLMSQDEIKVLTLLQKYS